MQDIFNQDGRSKCKEFIEITDANYVPEETVLTDVVIAEDGKIVVKNVLPPAKRGPKKKPAKELPCPKCKKVFAKEALLQVSRFLFLLFICNFYIDTTRGKSLLELWVTTFLPD